MTTEEVPPPELIVSELLLSIQHALQTGRNADEITTVFSNFYDDVSIHETQQHLFQLKLMGKRSEKRTQRNTAARERDIMEIVKCLVKFDWEGKTFKFVAVDLAKICHVPAGLGDELALRAEVRELKIKLQDLTSMFEEIKQISDSVKQSADEVKSLLKTATEPSELTSPDELAIAKSYKNITLRKPPCGIQITDRQEIQPDGSSRPETPILYSQVMAIQKDLEDAGNADDKTGEWKVVVKKTPPKRIRAIVGQLRGSSIQSSRPVKHARRATIFVSRCKPDTSVEVMESEIGKNITTFKLDAVELLKTKFNTYTSFKVSFFLDDKKLSHCFNDVMKPELWGDGVLVKPFSMRKRITAAPSNQ